MNAMALSLRALILAFVSTLTAGEIQNPTFPEDVPVLRVDVGVLSLDVSVTDASGRPVEGLTSEDFRIFENGLEREVQYFGPSSAPYHVFLLFDTSGSTQHEWGFMRRMVEGLVDSLESQDRIAIGVFDARPTVLRGWSTPDRSTMTSLAPFVEGGERGGTTEFYRSVERIIEREFEDVAERKALIVLSDGRDTSLWRELVRRNRLMEPDQDNRFKDLLNTAERGGIPVYFLALNTERNLRENPMGGDEYTNLKVLYPDSTIPADYLTQVRIRMERIAAATGGQVLFPSDMEQVVALFEELGAALGQAYSLGYSPRPAGAGEGLRSISVTVAGDGYSVRQSRESFQPK